MPRGPSVGLPFVPRTSALRPEDRAALRASSFRGFVGWPLTAWRSIHTESHNFYESHGETLPPTWGHGIHTEFRQH